MLKYVGFTARRTDDSFFRTEQYRDDDNGQQESDTQAIGMGTYHAIVLDTNRQIQKGAVKIVLIPDGFTVWLNERGN